MYRESNEDAAEPSFFAAELISQWLDMEEEPKLIVKSDMRVLWRNRAADAELRTGASIKINKDGNLCLPRHEDDLSIRAFVRTCTPVLRTLNIRLLERSDQILIRGRRLTQLSNPEGVVGLTFYRAGAEFSMLYADLEKVFQLTGAEHKILMLLLDGDAAADISKALSISLVTVRTHIRNIYKKLGVNTREKMFKATRPFRL